MRIAIIKGRDLKVPEGGGTDYYPLFLWALEQKLDPATSPISPADTEVKVFENWVVAGAWLVDDRDRAIFTTRGMLEEAQRLVADRPGMKEAIVFTASISGVSSESGVIFASKSLVLDDDALRELVFS